MPRYVIINHNGTNVHFSESFYSGKDTISNKIIMTSLPKKFKRWNHIVDTQHILINKLLLKRTQTSCSYDQYRYIMSSLN